MEIFAIIAAFVGAAFCFTLAGAVMFERPGTSEPHDMLNLFGITPDNADRFMWPVDSAA